MSDFAIQALSIAQGFTSELIGLFVSLFATLILYFFRLRPKLVFGRPHSSRHVINLADGSEGEPDNPLEIYNEQFFIANQGRRAAKQVDVVLSDFPRNISVNPPCDWTCKRIEGSSCQGRCCTTPA